MSLPVRLFRLSCGCLREYPMMPARTVHTVLCPRCRAAADTTCVYPEKACGTTGWAWSGGLRIPVSCTLARWSCAGWHIDTIAGVEFFADGARLARSREGKTGRA